MRSVLLSVIFLGCFIPISVLWSLALPTLLSPDFYAMLIAKAAWIDLFVFVAGTIALVAAWYSFFNFSLTIRTAHTLLKSMLLLGILVSLAGGFRMITAGEPTFGAVYLLPIIGILAVFMRKRSES